MGPAGVSLSLNPDVACRAASSIAREADEALAHRCALAVLVYPVLWLMAVLVAPGESYHLPIELFCGLVLLVLSAMRFTAAVSLLRNYPPAPSRWRRNFRLAANASALVWAVFALQEMSANGDGWPTWMILLMCAGISAGATTSLCPDPPLLRSYQVTMLGPLILWGLVRGGRDGAAIALVTTVHLVFILAQGHHNSLVFCQTIFDQQALREANRRRESLVNSIDGIVWEADPLSRQFTFVSQRAASLLGYSLDPWLAEPSFWMDHIHPDDRERIVRYDSCETAAGRDHVLEYRMLAADGRAVWLRDLVSVSMEGSKIVACRGVMVDITGRKQASAERNMLAHAVRTVGDAVAITDMENRIQFVNDAFLQMHGFTRSELLSRRLAEMMSDINPPGLAPQITEGTAQGGWQGEVWVRRKDGSDFPITLSTSLVRDEFGKTIAQMGVARDISQRKATENELRRAKEAAEAANLAKSRFLANMSHEIRTPMNGIIGMNHLLLGTPLNQRQRRYAEVIGDSAGSLLTILNDILDFSRIEAGKLESESTDFDLHSIVGGVCDLLAVKAQEKRVELLWLIDREVPTHLRGEATRLRQALTNLVGNAVKFTETGEVSVRVRSESAGEPAVLRFEVSDTGIGVPKEKQPLLFQPFSQADSSTTRRYGGAGLGLSIVRGLVEAMGGHVGFESREDVGSRFWFTAAFPLQPAFERPPMLSLAGRRVLVADDNAATRDLLANVLGWWGCRAELATDGDTAIRRLLATGGLLDAVMVDLEMPGNEGGRLGAAIRQDPALAAIPIILMVPLREGPNLDHWRQLGFAAIVTKPIKQSELGSCLASLMRIRPMPARAGGAASEKPAPQSEFRLLLVEDDPINQEVAVGILQEIGYREVEVVCDGTAALEALARADFDLVLMDCQLPGLDGYETSRLIRQSHTPVRNHLVPIVALTAHAMAGDAEKCLASGMNDYVSKPIRLALFEKVIARWLPEAVAAEINDN